MATKTSYPASQSLLLVAYVLSNLIAILDNAFIIRTIRHRRMRTTTFALIANQAFSDLMCGLLYLSQLFLCSTRLLSFGLPGIAVCEASFTLMLATFQVSILSMCAISIERYLKLCRPHGGYVLQPRLTIFSIWGLALLVTMLNSPETRFSQFFTPTQIFGCRISIPTGLPFFRSHYNHVLLLLFTVVCQVTVLNVMYYKIIRKIWGKKPVVVRLDVAHEAFDENKRQMTKMLLVILVSYTIFCAPLLFTFAVHYFVVEILPEPCNAAAEEAWWFHVASFLILASAGANPFIYCKYNRVFRSEAETLLQRIRRTCTRDQAGGGGDGGDELWISSKSATNTSSTSTSQSSDIPVVHFARRP